MWILSYLYKKFLARIQVYIGDYNFDLPKSSVKRPEYAQINKSSAPSLLKVMCMQKLNIIFKSLEMLVKINF